MIREVQGTLGRHDLAVQVRELHNGTEYVLKARDGTTRRYRVSKEVRQGGSEAMALFVITFNGLLLTGGERRAFEGRWVQAILQVRVRPGCYASHPGSLGNKHWPMGVRFDPNFATLQDLEWLVEDPADVIVTGVPA